MKPLDKPLEIILKKTTEKHGKTTHAVLARLNCGTKVGYFLVDASPGDTSTRIEAQAETR
jgi:hypothetical protein